MATEIDNDQPDPALAPLVARLEDREPELDLWPGIATRLHENEPRMLRLHWPVALAAALTLVASTAAITMLLTNGVTAVPAPPVAPIAPGSQPEFSVSVLPAGYATASVTLAKAIDRLEQILAESSSDLDATTRQRIAAAIGQLDQAIAAARRQATAAPGNLTAARYLTQAMQRKLNVLEQVTTLVQQG